MFAEFIKLLTGWNREDEVNVFEGTESIADSAGTLTVRPQSSRLEASGFQRVVKRLAEAKCASFDMVCFDFSRVEELAGPWGVHFALLIGLGDDLRGRIRVLGLHGQPAALAWVFRQSHQVRPLLDGYAGKSGKNHAERCAAD